MAAPETTILVGDCRDVLATLPSDSVHTCVTSPPYYGLRSYGVGIENGEIGLEATPDAWLAEMVAVFREVKRVLRPDGTLWLNVGDSYAGSSPNSGGANANDGGPAYRISGMPSKAGRPKDLLLMPARLALALQADGWWVRSDIIWAKPNPMPESCTDRPTSSYEHVFLLAKGQWAKRSIKLTDFGSDSIHLSGNSKQTDPRAWACILGVSLATAILNSADVQQHLGGLSFEEKIRQERMSARDGHAIADLPPVQRIAAYAARLLNADASAKDFLTEVYRVGLVLRQRNSFFISGSSAEVFYPPSVNAYGETSIAVYDAGKIGEFDLVHGHIVAHTPTTCTYFYDADAVREDTSPTSHAWTPRPTDPARDKVAHVGNGHSDLRLQEHGSGRNARNVWSIPTEAFSEWTARTSLVPVPASEAQELGASGNAGGDDTARITSPDCPLHAGDPDRVPKGFCDGLSVDQLSRIRDTGSHPVQGTQSGSDPIPHTPARSSFLPSTNGCLGLEGSETATLSNTETRRTDLAPSSSERAISSGETASDRPRIEPSQLSPALTCRDTGESRSGSDSVSSPPPQTAGDSVHRSSLACCCGYYRKVTTKISHFATYPTELVSRCIRAGTSERGCCAACGAPWVRSTTKGEADMAHRLACGANADGGYNGQSTKDHDAAGIQNASDVKRRILEGMRKITTTGWSASCRCEADTVPATVLDPFGGSGTTGLVSHRLQRNAVLIELNPDYAEMARHRITTDAPLFTSWAPAERDPQDERMADLFAMAAD